MYSIGCYFNIRKKYIKTPIHNLSILIKLTVLILIDFLLDYFNGLQNCISDI